MYTRVAARIRTPVADDEWSYLDFNVSQGELCALRDFISETTGDGYDWIGMILSQVFPIIIKGKGRWYCSQWIAHALSWSGIVKWKKLGIYEFPDLHPGKLYEILSTTVSLPSEDTEDM